MLKTSLVAAFEDDRGTITDLIEDAAYAVTVVKSNKGAIRGNHLHKLTDQWAYVLSGRLRVASGIGEVTAEAGDMVYTPPGEPHAWEALEDTVCVVFTLGPRSGSNYESDTYRLTEPILT
ncbi:MAG TPA: cupin domain-containing protein [Streptosporangiaceae bacterium]